MSNIIVCDFGRSTPYPAVVVIEGCLERWEALGWERCAAPAGEGKVKLEWRREGEPPRPRRGT